MAYVKDLAKYTWLVAMAALLMYHVSLGQAFEYSNYCASQCKIGRGGNLCRCNAVHFAGKRTSDNAAYEQVAPGFGNSEEDVAHMLSYLLNPTNRIRNGDNNKLAALGGGRDGYQGQQEMQEEVGDNRGLIEEVEEKRSYPLVMPYRSWYREMKELMKGKLDRDE